VKLYGNSAIGQGISEEMRRDENVVLIGLDLGYGGSFGVSAGMMNEFGPKRIVEMPIAEAGYMGVGVGAAISGMRPIVELMYGDWSTIASDQIINQAASIRYMFGGRLNVPMVIRLPSGGYKREAGQHSHMLESWYTFIPGLKVIAPSNPRDAKAMIKAAIRDNNPVVCIEHKKIYTMREEVSDDPEYIIPIGKADVKREGTDVSVFCYSYMVTLAQKAAEELEKEGISVEIVDLRSLSPLDMDTIVASIKKTNHALCLQEAWLPCSVSSEVAAQIAEKAFDYLDAPIARIGAKFCPIPFAPVLEDAVLPSIEEIKAKIRSLVNG
jgi:pyruvate/2-oxoglutarate/acetoin dehydrogenase E1 component